MRSPSDTPRLRSGCRYRILPLSNPYSPLLMGWCPSNQVDGPARGYGTMSRESKCEAIRSVDKSPSTLNLEFKGLVINSRE